MFETLKPRLRTLARMVGFGAGLAVIGLAGLSILQTPIVNGPGAEPAAQVAPELLAIAAACLWMLLVVKL